MLWVSIRRDCMSGVRIRDFPQITIRNDLGRWDKSTIDPSLGMDLDSEWICWGWNYQLIRSPLILNFLPNCDIQVSLNFRLVSWFHGSNPRFAKQKQQVKSRKEGGQRKLTFGFTTFGGLDSEQERIWTHILTTAITTKKLTAQRTMTDPWDEKVFVVFAY